MAAVVLMTAVLIILQIFPVWAKEEQLYALSAVLMDGETGRVLYGKEAYKGRPNASTTKVMTCILALEMASGDDYVQVSRNAASQPQTHLGMREGQQFYLEDLLYSLMLKSHNDTAVAIAEHIGGSVEKFAVLMNEKAKVLGCKDTHFVTPNGLDAEDEGGIHHTTARDLALIMAYAIKNETFVHITQTRDYTFSDISGKEHYSVHNTNAFLDMETGVISGKPALPEMPVTVMSALYGRMKNCLFVHCWDVAGLETKIINGLIQKNCYLMAGKITVMCCCRICRICRKLQ